MSIDARIADVARCDEGYELYLQADDTRRAPVGQNKLIIVDPTWRPEVGMVIWGGADSVIIEAKPQRHYDRIGYTKLRERGAA